MVAQSPTVEQSQVLIWHKEYERKTMTDNDYLYEFRFRRHRRSFAHEGTSIIGPAYAGAFLKRICKNDDRERFYAIYLDVRGKVIGYECVAVGHMAGVEVHPREVFRGAILAGAHSIILGHNHPSGDPEPSQEDRQLTKRLEAAGELIGIIVIDHIVVTDTESRSCNAD